MDKLSPWWEFLEYEESFEIGLEAEEIALTQGDDVLLIFSRITLTHLNWKRGRFHNALAQLEKVERLVKKMLSINNSNHCSITKKGSPAQSSGDKI